MRTAIHIALACAALSLMSACRREEPLPPPPPVAPTTSWTAPATATVAQTLMQAAGRDAWAAQWRARNQGAVPVVAIRELEDRSGDNLPMAELRAAMIEALAEAGGDRLIVSPTASGSVILSGAASMAAAKAGADAINRYSIDVRITDPTGDVLWTGSVEHELPPQR